ncbi:SDR family oxidoreductase [Pseudonocardia endophytica]|uniref:NAD(P)-dependent dehydrogenase (Short-subunit alcohol dehydrogenase family) n=1 Tax=Pseudonocardia endophytica TaxID=401976 RepID=A0A4R1HSP6_PSEEN|nr:SDR family oxidoreductase [Pseudonocardia endophytica]TCK24361.1 NAD(P)-dependent dehydrogenase (short-subunit alcohol dehydrogenase family) [Pseudonocardia endophytica]
MTDLTLAGRSALVTGASRGIGYGVAAELLARGASVTITGRKQPDLDDAVASLGSPDRVLAVAGNAGDAAHRADAVDRAVARFGSLDVLVNNAGINPQYGPLVEADLGAVSKTFEVNVVAVLGWVQEAWRAWMAAHGGSIVNVASVAGLRSTGVIGAYGASKAALIRLTEELAGQMGPTVRVNAVAPAVVKTRFAEKLYAHDEEGVAAGYPLKRLGEPSDVAAAVAFLASAQSGWITGDTIRVDGGTVAAGAYRSG